MATTIVAIDEDNKKHYLNVLKGQPVTIDLNFKDITDLKTKGSHTYNFRLPSSMANDGFFSSYFMVGSYSDGTNNNFNPFIKTEAYILQDDIEVFSGSLQLTNVFLREGNRYEYEIIIYASSVTFMDDLKGVNLNDVDLTEYNHTPAIGLVKESWASNQIASGKVVYSLYDYGNGNATSLAETFINPLSTNVALDGENMFNISKLRPQVQVRSLITKILAHKGYTYTSAFFDTAEFAKIFCDANYNGSETLESQIPTTAYKVVANNSSSFIVNYNAMFAAFKTPTVALDNFNDFNDTDFSYDPPHSGLYQFTIGFTIDPTNNLGANSPLEIRVNEYATSTGDLSTETVIAQTINVGDLTATYTSITQIQLDASKFYRVEVYTPNGINYFAIAGEVMTITNAFIQIDLLEGATSQQTVDLGVLFSGLTCLSFMQSIIKKFNLVVIPNKENNKELYIEPYKDYMSTTTAKNWDKKIDFKKDVQIVPPTKLAGKNVVFKDEPSRDYVYQSFAKIHPYTYGEYTEYLGNEFSEKDNNFTSIFSPTIAYPMHSGNFYSSPIIVPDGNGYKNVGGIRLSFYHGAATLPDNQRIRLTDTYQQTQNNQGLQVNTVPYFSPFSEQYFTNSNTVYTLNWGCTLTTDIVTWETIPLQGLAFKYWLAYIKNNFDINARMLVAYLWLTPRDIKDFQFNDTIRINGEDYIVNSIKGYPVSSAGVCKVELLKTYNTFTEFNIFSDSTDCGTIADYNVFYGMIQNAAGNILQDEGCCTALGFYYYNGSFGTYCYNTPNPNQQDTDIPHSLLTNSDTNNNINGNTNVAQFEQGGNIRGSFNTVVKGGREVQINGDNNVIRSKCSQINITGDNNEINEQVTKTTVVGKNNFIEPYKDYRVLNGETLNYTNSLTNINITGDQGKALNNNETILSTGLVGFTQGSNQSVTHLIKTSVAGGLRDAWIGKEGAFTTYPNSATYNTDLNINSFRLPQKTVILLRITLQATTATTTNTLNTQTWNEVTEFKILSGTAPIILSSTQISSSQSSQFSGATISIIPTSNIPYVYNAYLIKLGLPFSTLVNECDYSIKTEYSTTPLAGTVTSNILPTDISNLRLWLDASNFSSLGFNTVAANGQLLSSWNDLSGASNNVAQTNATYMPRWFSGYTNGRPYIDWDGTSACMFSTASALTLLANSDNTFIAVFESDITTSETSGQIVTGVNTSTALPRAGIAVNPNGSWGGASNDSVSYYNSTNLGALFTTSIASAGVTDPKIVVGRKNGTALDIIDENGSTNTGTGSSTTTGAYYTVGGRWTGSVDYAEFNGRIHEIIVYSDNISNAERDRLIFYLKNKWNIQ